MWAGSIALCSAHAGHPNCVGHNCRLDRLPPAADCPFVMLPTRIPSTFLLAGLLALPTLSACDGGDDEGGDTAADSNADSETEAGDGDGDGDGDTGMDVGNCASACAAVEACGQAAYDASPNFADQAECNTYCQGQHATFDADGCGDAFGDIQTCVAGLSCEDLTAYLTDPVAAGVCTDEAAALGECLP